MSIEVFPVVHVTNEAQAREQASSALDTGADGLYLVGGGQIAAPELLRVSGLVMKDNPDQFVGVNCLDLRSSKDVFTLINEKHNSNDNWPVPSGVWVDDASIDAWETSKLRSENPHLTRISYLGGVAFKYTAIKVTSIAGAVEEAYRLSPYVDVVTTSGLGTGKPPSVEKVSMMKRIIRPQRLAIASGIGIHNIDKYRKFVDQVLVGSSIKVQPYSDKIDMNKLQRLVDYAHSK